MEMYVLHNTADKEKFFAACEQFEKQYPEFKKLPPFEDKSNNALFQRYEKFQKTAVIILETLWYERVVIKSNFDINQFVQSFNGGQL